MKVLLVIPDGVGVRNFLCSEFAELAASEGDLVVWHRLPPSAIDEHRQRLGDRVRWHELEVRREPLTARVLRSAKFFSQFERFPEPGAARLLVNRNTSVPSRWVHRAGRLLGKLLGRLPSLLPWVERTHARSALGRRRPNPWQELLEREQPDVVLCTHQRASVAVPPMAAARRLGMPTATFIYSWDNLPKGRMAVWPEHYLVWSEKMAADLHHYYPETRDDQVHVVGTPQFEPYADASLLRSRDSFCARLGLDPSRLIVLFSGDDASTSPRDPDYLGDLADALADDPGHECPQLVFRRAPTDLSDRYRRVLDAHPEISVAEPAWNPAPEAGWELVTPTALDRELLANLVHHCAVVVNLGSTMALDFALAGKPAIYVSYDQADYHATAWRTAQIYDLPHFASVHRTGPVLWARSADELGPLVRRALTHPAELSASREAWIDIELTRPIDQASRRCLSALADIVARR